MSKGSVMKILFLLPLFLAAADVAFASEGHAPRWGDFAWRIVNLVLFCAILWYFTRNIIKGFFRNRKENIQNTLTELEKRREEAKARLNEIEKRIANLESERNAILEESRAQAERLKQGIVADAQRQAGQIVEQAKRAAENEGRAMLDQVRSKVANEIVDAASKALAGQLTEEDHDRLIANSLDKVALQ